MRLITYILLIAVPLICGETGNSEDVKVVQTPQGPVRGYRDPNYNLFVFQSIPYATAPTGIHRYQAPLPAPAFLETFDAVDKGIVCPQNADKKNIMMTGNKNIEENCLVASVYVTGTPAKKLPVVVYVHGGGFQMGYGDAFTPKEFIKDRNIIAVTFNYRLAVHGFLCLGTDLVPGNAGMKDQVALLRWVKKNIASFGGNPDDVTITGYSAGSASVDLLLLSPTTKGLFRRAIPESGTNIALWVNEVDPIEKAKYIAKKLNFTDVEDVYALENFYTTAPLELLNSYLNMNEKGSFGFAPCVERITNEEMFLAHSPFDILKSGKFTKVPLLYGFANMEGLLRLMSFDVWKDDMNAKFSDFLPPDLIFDSEEQKEEVAANVKSFYFGDRPVDDSTILQYVEYFTDITFAYPALRSVQLQQKAGNDKIYLYEYSFVEEGGNPTGYKDFKVNGATHCAQTAAILDAPAFMPANTHISEEYKKLKQILADMWYNFITTDQPVPAGSSLPAWSPMGAERSPHMSLGNTVELRGPLIPERALFWDRIYEQYYRNPQAPPAPPARHSEL